MIVKGNGRSSKTEEILQISDKELEKRNKIQLMTEFLEAEKNLYHKRAAEFFGADEEQHKTLVTAQDELSGCDKTAMKL